MPIFLELQGMGAAAPEVPESETGPGPSQLREGSPSRPGPVHALTLGAEDTWHLRKLLVSPAPLQRQGQEGRHAAGLLPVSPLHDVPLSPSLKGPWGSSIRRAGSLNVGASLDVGTSMDASACLDSSASLDVPALSPCSLSGGTESDDEEEQHRRTPAKPRVVNMVCTAPRGTRTRYQVAYDEPFHPLRLASHAGEMLQYKDALQWTVGVIPQTWVAEIADGTNWGVKSDVGKLPQGLQLEVIDVGRTTAEAGECYPVKPLGAFLMVDPGGRRLAWKVVGVALHDELAAAVHDMGDLARRSPELLEAVCLWLKTDHCRLPGLPPATLALGERAAGRPRALSIIWQSHESWKGAWGRRGKTASSARGPMTRRHVAAPLPFPKSQSWEASQVPEDLRGFESFPDRVGGATPAPACVLLGCAKGVPLSGADAWAGAGQQQSGGDGVPSMPPGHHPSSVCSAAGGVRGGASGTPGHAVHCGAVQGGSLSAGAGSGQGSGEPGCALGKLDAPCPQQRARRPMPQESNRQGSTKQRQMRKSRSEAHPGRTNQRGAVDADSLRGSTASSSRGMPRSRTDERVTSPPATFVPSLFSSFNDRGRLLPTKTREAWFLPVRFGSKGASRGSASFSERSIRSPASGFTDKSRSAVERGNSRASIVPPGSDCLSPCGSPMAHQWSHNWALPTAREPGSPGTPKSFSDNFGRPQRRQRPESSPLPGLTPKRAGSSPLPGLTPKRAGSSPLPGLTARRAGSSPLPGRNPKRTESGPLPSLNSKCTGSSPLPGLTPRHAGSSPLPGRNPKRTESGPLPSLKSRHTESRPMTRNVPTMTTGRGHRNSGSPAVRRGPGPDLLSSQAASLPGGELGHSSSQAGASPWPEPKRGTMSGAAASAWPEAKRDSTSSIMWARVMFSSAGRQSSGPIPGCQSETRRNKVASAEFPRARTHAAGTESSRPRTSAGRTSTGPAGVRRGTIGRTVSDAMGSPCTPQAPWSGSRSHRQLLLSTEGTGSLQTEACSSAAGGNSAEPPPDGEVVIRSMAKGTADAGRKARSIVKAQSWQENRGRAREGRRGPGSLLRHQRTSSEAKELLGKVDCSTKGTRTAANGHSPLKGQWSEKGPAPGASPSPPARRLGSPAANQWHTMEQPSPTADQWHSMTSHWQDPLIKPSPQRRRRTGKKTRIEPQGAEPQSTLEKDPMRVRKMGQSRSLGRAFGEKALGRMDWNSFVGAQTSPEPRKMSLSEAVGILRRVRTGDFEAGSLGPSGEEFGYKGTSAGRQEKGAAKQKRTQVEKAAREAREGRGAGKGHSQPPEARDAVSLLKSALGLTRAVASTQEAPEGKISAEEAAPSTAPASPNGVVGPTGAFPHSGFGADVVLRPRGGRGRLSGQVGGAPCQLDSIQEDSDEDKCSNMGSERGGARLSGLSKRCRHGLEEEVCGEDHLEGGTAAQEASPLPEAVGLPLLAAGSEGHRQSKDLQDHGSMASLPFEGTDAPVARPPEAVGLPLLATGSEGHAQSKDLEEHESLGLLSGGTGAPVARPRDGHAEDKSQQKDKSVYLPPECPTKDTPPGSGSVPVPSGTGLREAGRHRRRRHERRLERGQSDPTESVGSADESLSSRRLEARQWLPNPTGSGDLAAAVAEGLELSPVLCGARGARLRRARQRQLRKARSAGANGRMEVDHAADGLAAKWIAPPPDSPVEPPSEQAQLPRAARADSLPWDDEPATVSGSGCGCVPELPLQGTPSGESGGMGTRNLKKFCSLEERTWTQADGGLLPLTSLEGTGGKDGSIFS